VFARIGQRPLQGIHSAQRVVGARRGLSHQQPGLVIERRLVACFFRETEGACLHRCGREHVTLQAGEQREQLAVVGLDVADQGIGFLGLAGTDQDGGLQLAPRRLLT